MIIFFEIIIIIGVLIILFWQLSNVISIFSGCLFVTSDKKSSQEVIKIFAKKNAIFYELGSGLGTVLKSAAKQEMEVKGFEISPFYYLLSKINTWKYKNINIYFRNIKNVDLKNANIIYCYFTPKLLDDISSKFQKEIKKETILISKGFPIPHFTLNKKLKIKNRLYYIYKF